MTQETKNQTGTIIRISGPVVGAVGLKDLRLFDVVHVGKIGLIGEVIRLAGEIATIQVYEDTSGIQLGEPVITTQQPLVVSLGPGLLGQVYDGLQRPLEVIAETSGYKIQRGVSAPPLSTETYWSFTPRVSVGELVGPGDLLGSVPESSAVEHRILVPPRVNGRIVEIFSGKFTVDDVIAVIESGNTHKEKRLQIKLAHTWPVRQPRPIHSRLPPRDPLVTGTRIIDTFFPLAKGGTAIIPGGFGTGKTVVEHGFARWADADVVVYVGCGERGNEMTDVLEEFPKLKDPHTGGPLMERTVLIANTSNMPVAAREASVYTGITIAEYYRDMGYDVLMLADSTSRWGEALREISGRLEELPGEEGYPAYLAARLAEFYERSGRVICLGNSRGASDRLRSGSITVVGAVSPPGGDFSEPMTQSSMRLVGTFWALDYDLSRRRHFPAINWTRSYSLYDLRDWYVSNVSTDWNELINESLALLQRESELLEIVQLVGPDALAESELVVLMVARILREDFLQQSAFHPVDSYCSIEKGYWMLKCTMLFNHQTRTALEVGVSLEQIENLPVIYEIARMKEFPPETAVQSIQKIMDHVQLSFSELGGE
ncbi:MAG: V-type ATP synthase subunit A [Chloroflexota bacterium]|nr:V-type ATP synthase subunit A [Chloroflexota bacterium]